MRNRGYPDSSARDLEVMRILEREPDVTQRQLAAQVGISVEGVNHCVKALI